MKMYNRPKNQERNVTDVKGKQSKGTAEPVAAEETGHDEQPASEHSVEEITTHCGVESAAVVPATEPIEDPTDEAGTSNICIARFKLLSIHINTVFFFRILFQLNVSITKV